jgi:N-acetylglucosamine-6-sulfatase
MTKTKVMFSTGTTFRNSFVTIPLCCSSRAIFLTEQYPHNHGVFSNRPPEGGYTALNHANTLPVWLQATGYYTSHIGKYLNGYGADIPKTFVPPGWKNWQGLVDFSTYNMYDHTINDNGTLVRYGTAKHHYQTDVLANRLWQRSIRPRSVADLFS